MGLAQGACARSQREELALYRSLCLGLEAQGLKILIECSGLICDCVCVQLVCAATCVRDLCEQLAPKTRAWAGRKRRVCPCCVCVRARLRADLQRAACACCPAQPTRMCVCVYGARI